MMAETKIEWTDVPLHVRATAAGRIGISLGEYDERRRAGEKWCGGCRAWHAATEFAVDRSRGDGLTSRCRVFNNARGRADYAPKPGPTPGRRFVQARDGDQEQARRRVNYLVEAGLIAAPNTLPCADCAHVWTDGERRHEYDHHKGYAAQHHEDVEAVCTTCHHTREIQRRAA